MFDKLKKLLGTDRNTADDSSLAVGAASAMGSVVGSTAFGGLGPGDANRPPGAGIDFPAMERWARSIQAKVTRRSSGAPAIGGNVLGKPWRMELGRPSRDYMEGDELRMRAELDVNDDAVVLVMSRRLKDKLEKAAYSIYTDPLQTTVDPNMPEEMRWLAMYQEFGWEEVGVSFFDHFSVLADSRSRAIDFLSPQLAQAFMRFNRSNDEGHQLPLVMMVMRGKAYLRTVHQPADLATIQAAHALFEQTCRSAVDRLSTDLAL
jgi:hypothetical protein